MVPSNRLLWDEIRQQHLFSWLLSGKMASLHSLDRIICFWREISMNMKGIKARAVKSEAAPPAGDHVVLQPTSKSRCFRRLDVLISVENTQQLPKLYNCSQTVDCTSGKKTREKQSKEKRTLIKDRVTQPHRRDKDTD